MKETNQEQNKVVIYQSGDDIELQVQLENETVWLSQQQMADLFQTSRTNVVEHIQHIYEEGELVQDATCRNFRQVRMEGGRKVGRELPFYNLDMIISLGYRVKSGIATKFRIWATDVLRAYTIKGVVVNEKRLEQLGMMLDIVSRSEIAEVAGVGEVEKSYLENLKQIEKKVGRI